MTAYIPFVIYTFYQLALASYLHNSCGKCLTEWVVGTGCVEKIYYKYIWSRIDVFGSDKTELEKVGRVKNKKTFHQVKAKIWVS